MFNKFFNRLIASCLCLSGLAVYSSAAEPKAGDKAPEFKLQGSDGKSYSLAELKGKHVVVAWFPKAFTGGCTKECKSLKENSKQLKAFEKVAYFTASVDTAEQNKKFAESLDLDYPILSDPEKKVAEAYGVVHPGRDLPERWTFYIGPDGKILEVDKAVKTEEHGQNVAAKLKELGAK
jgi:peroxiredoxin Q/BCP